MKAKTFLLSILIYLTVICIYSESVHTELTQPKHIEIFHEVTSKIRCICLPSLPIKGCSYNNCAISSYIKKFIENQIQKGETTESIVHKMQYGFGDDIKDDPVIQHFIKVGNEQIVHNLVFGFGETILAEPNSMRINITIFAVVLLGLLVMVIYIKKRIHKRETNLEHSSKPDSTTEKYLEELD